jgi:hypothetical protein
LEQENADAWGVVLMIIVKGLCFSVLLNTAFVKTARTDKLKNKSLPAFQLSAFKSNSLRGRNFPDFEFEN